MRFPQPLNSIRGAAAGSEHFSVNNTTQVSRATDKRSTVDDDENIIPGRQGVLLTRGGDNSSYGFAVDWGRILDSLSVCTPGACSNKVLDAI